jgi:hypothetical protein
MARQYTSFATPHLTRCCTALNCSTTKYSALKNVINSLLESATSQPGGRTRRKRVYLRHLYDLQGTAITPSIITTSRPHLPARDPRPQTIDR